MVRQNLFLKVRRASKIKLVLSLIKVKWSNEILDCQAKGKALKFNYLSKIFFFPKIVAIMVFMITENLLPHQKCILINMIISVQVL